MALVATSTRMSSQAVKRASADYAELQKPIYAESGIFYAVDETNVQHGWACVFGPKDTPYEDCPMLYEITIPTTYPFEPPTVKFKTYDGKTRFHPNMYVDGKCCLSILHTWAGPRWASTMRLSTVLVTLQSLMDTDPIRHEPGYAGASDAMAKDYKSIVEHSCIQYSLERAESKLHPEAFKPFQELFATKRADILNRLKVRLETRLASGEVTWNHGCYSMTGTSNYGTTLCRVEKLIATLNTPA